MRLRVLKLVSMTMILLAGSGCCIPTEATIPALPLDARPTLPQWKTIEWVEVDSRLCVTADDLIKIKTRDKLLIGHCEKLEGVIKSTH